MAAAPDRVEHPPAPGKFPGTPRWVKIGAIFALVILLLVALALAFGPGDHGPGRHGGNHASSDHDRQSAPTDAAGLAEDPDEAANTRVGPEGADAST